ncbi:MAG TPA: SIMPL domain-containing protein [Flavisolibacter sp.]|nr:SIMPL domain-containing protein [Flavisolibacter sp.]
MKKIVFTLSMMFLAFGVFAQTDKNPYPRTISVTGTAEMEIIPDEIYVQVDLKEYDKKGQGKIGIDKIKQDFLNTVKALGIPDSLVSIAAYDGFNGNPWWRKKNKKDELYASISYLIKLKSSKQVDDLVDRLDDNATQNFFIQKTSSSKLEELRKKLKIEAIKVAKEKAAYLAGAIDEKIGVAVTINEPMEYYTPYVQNFRVDNKAVMEGAAATDDGAAPVDFKKIKLKYDVTVIFALQ